MTDNGNKRYAPYLGAKWCRKCKRWKPSTDPMDPREYEDYYCRCDGEVQFKVEQTILDCG